MRNLMPEFLHNNKFMSDVPIVHKTRKNVENLWHKFFLIKENIY